MDKKIKSCEIDVVARAKEYREPEVCWGQDCVTISFYAFDPESGSLRRKRMKMNRELKAINGKRARREFVQGVVDRLRDELKAGWNPWMQQSDGLVYASWEDACEHYKAYLVKQQNEHNMRPESVASYMSYQRVLKKWVATERM